MSALAIRQGTPEWLEARRDTIGSSDIPIIVGESSYKSAHTLAAEKLGLVEPEVDDETRELMDIGLLMQPVLLHIYERKTGRKPKGQHGWRVHPTRPWATASLDGIAPVRRIVEAKWTNAARWRSGERVPGDVQAQVQWQMFVTGWDVTDVVVMDRGVPRVEEVERDPEMIDNLVFFATRFHEQLERGELPEPDGSESSHRTLTRMFPVDNGVWLPATPDLAEMAEQLRVARATKNEADKTDKTLSNAIRAILGAATGIEGLLSAKKNADTTRVNWPAVAGAYRTLLEGTVSQDQLDALISIHSETSEGARPIRLLKGASE